VVHFIITKKQSLLH